MDYYCVYDLEGRMIWASREWVVPVDDALRSCGRLMFRDSEDNIVGAFMPGGWGYFIRGVDDLSKQK